MTSQMQIKIEAVDNGYVVQFGEGEDKHVNAYQEKDTDMPEEDLSHVVEMLFDVVEYFGHGGTKHDKKRILIEYKEQ